MKQLSQGGRRPPLSGPYLFVLKEGNQIKSDLFDYSLVLLQVGRAEVLTSPVGTRLSGLGVLPND